MWFGGAAVCARARARARACFSASARGLGTYTCCRVQKFPSGSLFTSSVFFVFFTPHETSQGLAVICCRVCKNCNKKKNMSKVVRKLDFACPVFQRGVTFIHFTRKKIWETSTRPLHFSLCLLTFPLKCQRLHLLEPEDAATPPGWDTEGASTLLLQTLWAVWVSSTSKPLLFLFLCYHSCCCSHIQCNHNTQTRRALFFLSKLRCLFPNIELLTFVFVFWSVCFPFFSFYSNSRLIRWIRSL